MFIPIVLPEFAVSLIKKLPCKHCRAMEPKYAVLAAGVRRNPSDWALCFWVELDCPHCRQRTSFYVQNHNLDSVGWAEQIAASMCSPKSSAIKNPLRKRSGNRERALPTDNADAQKREHGSFFATTAEVLDCTPGNFGHAEGKNIAILTIARGDEIEQIAIPIQDAKIVVTKMLIALATYEDQFAQMLLDYNFSADGEGNFKWPRQS